MTESTFLQQKVGAFSPHTCYFKPTLSLNGLHFFLTVQFPFFVSLLILKSDLWNLVLLCRLVILALRKLKQDYKFKAKLGDIVRPCVNNSNHPHDEQAAVPENDHGAEQNWPLARGKVWYKDSGEFSFLWEKPWGCVEQRMIADSQTKDRNRTWKAGLIWG